jgi:flagellar motor switch protein FliG
MGLLQRFKKPGGMEKLVELIESSESKVRENILAQIREEDAEFTAQVEAQLFFWPDIFKLDDMTLTDILTAVPLKTLATAMFFLEDHQKQQLLDRLDHQTQAKIREEQEAQGTNVQKGIVATSRQKVIETARELEGQGRIQLRKKGPGGVVMSVTASSAPTPAAAAPAGGTATASKPTSPANSKSAALDAKYQQAKANWDRIYKKAS